jgi:hypothetical protein
MAVYDLQATGLPDMILTILPPEFGSPTLIIVAVANAVDDGTLEWLFGETPKRLN